MTVPAPLIHLSYDDQLERLKSRGLVVGDEALAVEHLHRVGYYRLQSYLHPLRKSETVEIDGRPRQRILEEFRDGTEFQHAVDLYVFDKRLRVIMADAIERIEIALRVDLSHCLGRRNPSAHRELGCLDPATAADSHEKWLDRAGKLEARSRTDWIVTARKAGQLPIWKAIETYDFGALVSLLEMSHRLDRAEVAARYGIPNATMHARWMWTLGYVRNITAHHARLWNHALVIQPMIPKKGQIPRLDHLATYTTTQSRVYAAAAICQFLMATIAPKSAWTDRLKALWDAFPTIPEIRQDQAGFMPSWKTWDLWVSQ